MIVIKLKTSAASIMTACVLAAGAGLAAPHALQDTPAPEQRKADTRPETGKTDTPKAEEAGKTRKDYYGDPLPPGVLARMGTLQLRHGFADITFSPDGKTLISATSKVCFWDVATGKESKRLEINVEMPKEPTLSLTGKIFAARELKEIRWYETETGKQLGRIATDVHEFAGLRLSPNEKLIAAKSRRGRPYLIRLWDTETGREIITLPHEDWITTFVFSPDGHLLASLSADKTLHLWDTKTAQEKNSVPGEGEALAFAPDGKSIATALRDGTVTLWDADGLVEKGTLKPSKKGKDVRSMDFSQDGKWLGVGGSADVVIWNVAKEKEEWRLPQGGCRRMAFAPDSKTLACAGNYLIRLWDVTTGKEVHHRAGHDNQVYGLSVSSDGKFLASSCTEEPAVNVWDAASGKPIGTFAVSADGVRSCDFSPDGKFIIAPDMSNGDLCFLETASGKESRLLCRKPVPT
jgi:WD40 repeat protein